MSDKVHTLAEALPEEIKRVEAIREEFKALRGMPNVIVEPQIAMMSASIDRAIRATAAGDVVEMWRAYQDLQEWEE